MADAHAHADDHAHDHTPKGWRRWVYSTNHKDIGTMYLTFSIIAGIIGGIFSILMRLELQDPAPSSSWPATARPMVSSGMS